MSLEYLALGMMIFVGIVFFYGIIAIHDIPYEIAKKRGAPERGAAPVASTPRAISTAASVSPRGTATASPSRWIVTVSAGPAWRLTNMACRFPHLPKESRAATRTSNPRAVNPAPVARAWAANSGHKMAVGARLFS
jgi:hypothetical protein